MNKLIGRFYFKLTDSKNLIGEFSNNYCNRNYTESAVPKKLDNDKSKKPDDGKFIGDYFSTWYEENNKSVLADLEITQKPDCENIFLLKWTIANQTTFWGEAMLCDGILIGDYRNFEKLKN